MIGRNFGQHCPYCNYLNDGYTGLTDNIRPKMGDVSICFNCAGIGIFEPDLSIRIPTHLERQTIEQVEEVQAAVKSIVEMRGLNATFH